MDKVIVLMSIWERKKSMLILSNGSNLSIIVEYTTDKNGYSFILIKFADPSWRYGVYKIIFSQKCCADSWADEYQYKLVIFIRISQIGQGLLFLIFCQIKLKIIHNLYPSWAFFFLISFFFTSFLFAKNIIVIRKVDLICIN